MDTKQSAANMSSDSEIPLTPPQTSGKWLRVWYRHTGESEIHDIPVSPTFRFIEDETQITKDVRGHVVTHMYILSGVVPSLATIAPQLTQLKLGSTVGSLQCLNSLTQLRLLNLNSHKLSGEFPVEVLQLSALESLSLDNCLLSNLPDSLTSLTQLKSLNLNTNNFSKGLPNVVGELNSLEELSLDNCQLTELPQSLGSLKRLKCLYLHNNSFSKGLPAVVGQLDALEMLWLYQCQLRDLPQSLSSLKNLKYLYLNYNKFRSKGLPAVVEQISTLKELRLDYCQLSDLPPRLNSETGLQVLSLRSNHFVVLPSAIYLLKRLRKLDISRNYALSRMEKEISYLGDLEELKCDNCDGLKFPMYDVCVQGISAVRKYFSDLELEKGVERLEVPVAVMGQLCAGKSSIIKSLKAGERTLTVRDRDSSIDETTRVFATEDLQLRDSQVKFIDYGGHEVYHMAYQLVIKERCIPLIVVNIEEFNTMSLCKGHREATRRVCIDWLSHLYLACPKLGPPMLALTHTDKLASAELKECRDKLLTSAETFRQELIAVDRDCSGELAHNAILHITNTELPLFHPEDIFEFSNNLSETSNIESLRDQLNSRCQGLTVQLPRLWEEVGKFILRQKDKPYIPLSEVMREFISDDPVIILRYMHNAGRILWFEDIASLSPYIFHQIPAITEMINLLLHHSTNEHWDMCLDTFTPFTHDQVVIGRVQYKSFVQQFTTTGVMHEALLVHLLKTGSCFPVQVSLELLKSFFILHGPIEQPQTGNSYILPCYAREVMDNSWLEDCAVPLRMDIVLGGLSLPQYVYQLMTVVVLNRTLNPLTNVSVKSNGAEVHHGDCTTYLIHDHNSSRVTLQVSTTIPQLDKSWTHLLETVRDILNLLSRVWKACYAEVVVYCAQCLILLCSDPAYNVVSRWFSLNCDITSIQTVTTISALEKVACPCCSGSSDSSKSPKPTVPRPLRFPCAPLTVDEVEILENHLAVVRASCGQREGTAESVQGRDADLESDVSDVEVEGYCDDSTNDKIYIAVRLRAVRDERVKELFNNSEKVYAMSERVRGRALIINNDIFFNSGLMRPGSDVDYDNISRMFSKLRFDIAKSQKALTNLSVEHIYKEIREETQRTEHEKLGMFVLVIMSHGTQGGMILDCNSRPVPLVNIQDLLSPTNFPAMKGKPKVMIVQACSGDRGDHGESRDLPSQSDARTSDLPSQSAAKTSDLPNQPSTSSGETLTFFKAASRDAAAVPQPPNILNADDFFIMKASSESYIATRSSTHGSWFIRVLVATFYKHSCHRDVETLFKIIQQRVRQVSLTHKSDTFMGGNVPTSICTFTNYRKLYLFPGFPLTR